MKKILGVLLILMLTVAMFAGCGTKTSKGFEIALITDKGNIDDKSFNQGAWEGVVAFAEANKITHKYYKPTEQSTDAYLAAIQLAVNGGAKVIVTPGFLFEEPIFKAQDLYPNVTFILIDGKPHDKDNKEFRTNKNAVGITFAEEQSGYLAGYAAVKDGYTKLGFMGGMAVPAVIRYGYGYVQGAEAAAREMGIKSIDLKYHYTGGFDATPEVQTLAASWYAKGTEVIFGCGGAVGNSVMSAAAAAKAKAIGVDVDQSSESPTVITSAMKGLGAAVQSVLTGYYTNKFPGGQSLIYAADKNGVKLPMDSSKFTKFTKTDYDKIFESLAAGKIKIATDKDASNADKLPVSIVKVSLVK
jgi:basic membrane protein A